MGCGRRRPGRGWFHCRLGSGATGVDCCHTRRLAILVDGEFTACCDAASRSGGPAVFEARDGVPMWYNMNHAAPEHATTRIIAYVQSAAAGYRAGECTLCLGSWSGLADALEGVDRADETGAALMALKLAMLRRGRSVIGQSEGSPLRGPLHRRVGPSPPSSSSSAAARACSATRLFVFAVTCDRPVNVRAVCRRRAARRGACVPGTHGE